MVVSRKPCLRCRPPAKLLVGREVPPIGGIAGRQPNSSEDLADGCSPPIEFSRVRISGCHSLRLPQGLATTVTPKDAAGHEDCAPDRRVADNPIFSRLSLKHPANGAPDAPAQACGRGLIRSIPKRAGLAGSVRTACEFRPNPDTCSDPIRTAFRSNPDSVPTNPDAPGVTRRIHR